MNRRPLLLLFILFALAGLIAPGCASSKHEPPPETESLRASIENASSITAAIELIGKAVKSSIDHATPQGKPLLEFVGAMITEAHVKAMQHEVNLGYAKREVERLKQWGIDQQTERHKADAFAQELQNDRWYRTGVVFRRCLRIFQVTAAAVVAIVAVAGIASKFSAGPIGIVGGRIFGAAARATWNLITLFIPWTYKQLRGRK